MPASLEHQARRLSAALITTLAALSLAACGSSGHSGSELDPATVIPASAPLYAGATVRPGEPLKAAARAAGQALSHQADPYLRLLALLQTPGSATLDFTRDLAPWLGAHAAIFLEPGTRVSEAQIDNLLSLLQQILLGGSAPASAFPFGAHGLGGAIVLDTSDAKAARSFLEAQAAPAGAHAASYRGVSYQTTSAEIAFGVVDRLAVIGSASALRSVIDTTLGGASLASAPGYAQLLTSAPPAALAHLYADVGSLGSSASAVAVGGVPGLAQALTGSRLLNISLVPAARSIAVDADALSGASAPGSLLSSGGEAAQALGELPAESWFAFGLGDAGATLAAGVQGLHDLATLGSSLGAAGGGAKGSPAVAGLSVGGLLEGILAPLRVLSANSAEAKRDFASWMGSAGLFASGSGLLELKGGIAITSKDPSLSRAAVAKLAAKLRQAGGSVQTAAIPGTDASASAKLTGLPVVLYIADGRDSAGQTKFVIGLGEPSVQAALNPSSTLSGAASRAGAAAALGEGVVPSMLIEFPTLIGLLEGVGLTEDPTISPFLPYLRSATTLSGGARSLGAGMERFRLVLGLR